MLGMTLGVPALACFVAYVWLAFRGRQAVRAPIPSTLNSQPSTESAWLAATCRAVVIVLVVGFWFDGGLFNLALATPFWILLELGRAETLQPRVNADSSAALNR